MNPECITEKKDPLIVLKDLKGGRSKITFINEKRELIKEVQVEDCQIKEGKKCDFLILHPVKKKEKIIADEYFVELKGEDVVYACRQLFESVIKLTEANVSKQRYAFVVATKRRPATNTRIQKWEKDFNKKLKTKLVIKITPATHKLS